MFVVSFKLPTQNCIKYNTFVHIINILWISTTGCSGAISNRKTYFNLRFGGSKAGREWKWGTEGLVIRLISSSIRYKANCRAHFGQVHVHSAMQHNSSTFVFYKESNKRQYFQIVSVKRQGCPNIDQIF